MQTAELATLEANLHAKTRELAMKDMEAALKAQELVQAQRELGAPCHTPLLLPPPPIPLLPCRPALQQSCNP